MDTDAEASRPTAQEPGSSNIDISPMSLAGEPAFERSTVAMGNPEERSPLLSPNSSADAEAEELVRQYTENGYDKFEETKSSWYFVLLTLSLGGLQLAWAVEFSNGTPFLLSLGISKSVMALVWIAGPLSGTLVQPYVGVLSDNCRSPWGKRRPFMAMGAIATVLSLAGLAWVREIVGVFLGIFGAEPASSLVKNSIIVVAVLLVYVLDFSINAVQAAIRAFILDCCPSHQQETANAMASRVVGIGTILGYLTGYLNMRDYLWFFGKTQFQVLCVLASIALGATVMISSATVEERDPRLEGPPANSTNGVLDFFRSVFKSIRRLPPQTRKVCEVQFFSWIGWFPHLFYSTSYVGDIYVQSFLRRNPDMSEADLDDLYEKATRIGTFALLCLAIVSLATNLLLPCLIAPTYDAPSKSGRVAESRTQSFLDSLIVPWLSLRRAWLISHLIFAGCMFSTLFIDSVNGATIRTALLGIPWALTLWAPFAIISAEVSKRDALRRSRNTNNEAEDEVDQAGVILGIHNMAIAVPQILATFLSSVAFKYLQKPRGTPGDHSFAYVLAAGGISTLVAAWLTGLIKDEVPSVQEAVAENGDASGTDTGRLRPYKPRRSSDRPLMRSGSFSGAGGDGF